MIEKQAYVKVPVCFVVYAYQDAHVAPRDGPQYTYHDTCRDTGHYVQVYFLATSELAHRCRQAIYLGILPPGIGRLITQVQSSSPSAP
jgi:hypothetical protein